MNTFANQKQYLAPFVHAHLYDALEFGYETLDSFDLFGNLLTDDPFIYSYRCTDFLQGLTLTKILAYFQAYGEEDLNGIDFTGGADVDIAYRLYPYVLFEFVYEIEKDSDNSIHKAILKLEKLYDL